MTELRDLFPELARKMAEDLVRASFFFFDEALMDYMTILNYATEIYLLPEEDPEPERQAVKAIRAFLRGHETREELIDRLRTILENCKEKTEEEV